MAKPHKIIILNYCRHFSQLYVTGTIHIIQKCLNVFEIKIQMRVWNETVKNFIQLILPPNLGNFHIRKFSIRAPHMNHKKIILIITRTYQKIFCHYLEISWYQISISNSTSVNFNDSTELDVLYWNWLASRGDRLVDIIFRL